MTSINAASTPAFASASAVAESIIPVCTITVNPNSRLIFSRTGMNCLRGTEPSGRHPPLTRHPKAPFCFNFEPSSRSFSGVLAGCMVSRTLLPQCLQLSAQSLPVTDIVGK